MQPKTILQLNNQPLIGDKRLQHRFLAIIRYMCMTSKMRKVSWRTRTVYSCSTGLCSPKGWMRLSFCSYFSGVTALTIKLKEMDMKFTVTAILVLLVTCCRWGVPYCFYNKEPIIMTSCLKALKVILTMRQAHWLRGNWQSFSPNTKVCSPRSCPSNCPQFEDLMTSMRSAWWKTLGFHQENTTKYRLLNRVLFKTRFSSCWQVARSSHPTVLTGCPSCL